MGWLNVVVGGLVSAALLPFRTLPPMVGLSVLALITAIGMLLVVRATSNQQRIAAVKRQIQAGLFEIRLFNDDLRATFRAQGDILRHNVTYLRLSLVPMMWMLVPIALLLAQLQFYYGYDGLQPGQTALLKVVLAERATFTGVPPIGLTAPAGVRVETPLVWIPSQREAAWRIAADQPGDYQLDVTLAGRAVTKQLKVSDAVGWRTPERLERGFLNQLMYPAESPIESDVPIQAIEITYPEREVNLLGWHTDWMIAFFVLSIVFAFALKNRLGVVI